MDERIADAEAFTVRTKKRIASTNIVEAEKQKQISEQELAHEMGQWFRCSDRSCACVGGRALASSRRAGSAEGGRTRGRSSMWIQRQTGPPHWGACSDSTHTNSGSRRVECMVGRTSFRIARRIVARRQHPCSGIERQVVGRSRAHDRDDRRDDQLSALPPPWRAVGATVFGETPRAVESGMWSHVLVGGETVTTSPLETVPASQSDLATVGVQHSVDVPVLSNSLPVPTRVESAPILRDESADDRAVPLGSVRVSRPQCQPSHQSPLWLIMLMDPVLCLPILVGARWRIWLAKKMPIGFVARSDGSTSGPHRRGGRIGAWQYLFGSHRHDQELCATRRDTDSESVRLADHGSRARE